MKIKYTVKQPVPVIEQLRKLKKKLEENEGRLSVHITSAAEHAIFESIIRLSGTTDRYSKPLTWATYEELKQNNLKPSDALDGNIHYLRLDGKKISHAGFDNSKEVYSRNPPKTLKMILNEN